MLNLGLPCKGNSQGQPNRNPASGEFLRKMQDITARAKQCMAAAQQRQKRYYDLKHKFQEYGIGEQVLLSSKNLQLKTAGTPKLWPRWIGPFIVIDRLGEGLSYKLDLPERMSKTHPVFHVGLLQKYMSNGTIQPPPLPELVDDEFEYIVEAVLGHRQVKTGKQHKTGYLVKWLGYGNEHDTFEPAASLANAKQEVQGYWQQQLPESRLVAIAP